MTQPKQKITKEEIAVINRAKAGDESAFKWIFKRYKRFVDKLLYDYLKDKDEARDITNVVFLKVHQNLSKFSTYESFGGWLRILTKRTAIDYLRTTENQRQHLTEITKDVLQVPSDERIEDDTVNRLTTKRVFEVLDRYQPNVKKIFELHYLKNMSVEMVASKLRLPVGTVKSILSRTRNKIRKDVKLKES